jgi:hypothetical protein
MHWLPADLLELLRGATIVVDNARRPDFSATEDAPSMPSLCWCEAPAGMNVASERPRKPSSRWESSPHQNQSIDKRCNNVHQARRPACFAKHIGGSSKSSIHAACTVDSSFGQSKTTLFPLRDTLIHFKSTSVDERPRPPPRRRSACKALPTTTTAQSTPGETHVVEALQQAIVLSHRLDCATLNYDCKTCIVAGDIERV